MFVSPDLPCFPIFFSGIIASVMISRIAEINSLWEPVYPHLARHVAEVYGRREGSVLEAGPFCGVIYDLARQKVGDFFCIASFPSDMDDFYRFETRKRQMEDTVDVIGSTPSLDGIEDRSVDLVVFRGALFFPELFRVDYKAIVRVLREGGVAFIGGGFGKYTPVETIAAIGGRSRELNLLIGKTDVTPEDVRLDLSRQNVAGQINVVTEGGLWVVIKKP